MRFPTGSSGEAMWLGEGLANGKNQTNKTFTKCKNKGHNFTHADEDGVMEGAVQESVIWREEGGGGVEVWRKIVNMDFCQVKKKEKRTRGFGKILNFITIS